MTYDPDNPQPGDIAVPLWERLLTPTEIHAATKWINDHSAREGDPCPVCDSPNSVVQQSVAAMPGGVSPYHEGQSWILPSVVVICQNCAYTRYFNAIVMGLTEAYRPLGEGTDGSSD